MSYYFKEKRAESSASQRIVNFTLTSSKNADNINPFALHNHDIFELSAVTMGRLDISIDEVVYELSEGDIMFSVPSLLSLFSVFNRTFVKKSVAFFFVYIAQKALRRFVYFSQKLFFG